MALDRKTFLASRPLAISKPIRLPGRADGEFAAYVRELSGLERAELDARRYMKNAAGNAEFDIGNDDANWVAATVCDEAGSRLLTWSDLDAVKTMPAAELAVLASEARKINRTGAAAVNDAVKN